MRERCSNPNKDNYAYYGGRGIAVASEWDSFWQFVEDMGPRPDGFTLDRKDNSGPYCKDNCRWAHRVTQSNNRPGYNVTLTYNGRTQSIAEWARECGIKYGTLHERLRRGWSTEKALACLAK